MGFVEFVGWFAIFFIVFSLLFTPGGLALLFLFAVTGLLLLPFVLIAQLLVVGEAVKKEKE